ncbi:alpha/beta hydrolase [Actinosynnema sp. ALI-1.44]|uniref:alpha/beta fold hydrolase n=1 Tax=Actinosynnema sp. ALI-1.44 TaxID=1933779 RepID=UPI00097BEF8F|nr:alpha/beta fold hydrolase [Actinosynnema sp. ALI-1.44]ONI87852.1 alpha/beta hydrolase [Actinosynnema sp. ALI-1.44]
MTAVFVHGNPESAAIWTALLDELAKVGNTDTVCLSPPGFGAPLPDHFAIDVTGYRDWLIAELERFNGPVHLVGHDWGGGHVVNVAMTRPDLLRSWASDAIGIFDPHYVWHDLAQRWQADGVGEADVAAQFGAPHEEKTEQMVSLGFERSVAEHVAHAQNPDMGRALLGLYRTARQPAMAEFGRALPDAAARPGLALVASEDHYVGSVAQRRRAAARARARVEVLEGCGHWWMAEAPAEAADVLTRFWASAPDRVRI